MTQTKNIKVQKSPNRTESSTHQQDRGESTAVSLTVTDAIPGQDAGSLSSSASNDKVDDTDVKCEVCFEPAPKRCGRCKSVFYCSEEHQKENWRTHRPHCVKSKKTATNANASSAGQTAPKSISKPEPNYRIEVVNDELGTCMIANRDFERGELIVEELPAVVLPLQMYGEQNECLLNCFGCFKPIIKSANQIYRCSKCGIPVCGTDCEKAPQHRDQECKVIREMEGRMRIRGLGYSLKVLQYYMDISILRLLLYRQNNMDGWNKFVLLEETPRMIFHKTFPIYSLNGTGDEENLTFPLSLKFTKNNTKLVEQAAELLFTFWEIFLALEEAPRVRVVYPTISALRHSCLANTAYSYNGAQSLVVSIKAAKDIRKGDILTLDFNYDLWASTPARRQLLLQKNIICICPRCQDPTELNSFCSGMQCQKCSSGLFLPTSSLHSESPSSPTTTTGTEEPASGSINPPQELHHEFQGEQLITLENAKLMAELTKTKYEIASSQFENQTCSSSDSEPGSSAEQAGDVQKASSNVEAADLVPTCTGMATLPGQEICLEQKLNKLQISESEALETNKVKRERGAYIEVEKQQQDPLEIGFDPFDTPQSPTSSLDRGGKADRNDPDPPVCLNPDPGAAEDRNGSDVLGSVYQEFDGQLLPSDYDMESEPESAPSDHFWQCSNSACKTIISSSVILTYIENLGTEYSRMKEISLEYELPRKIEEFVRKHEESCMLGQNHSVFLRAYYDYNQSERDRLFCIDTQENQEDVDLDSHGLTNDNCCPHLTESNGEIVGVSPCKGLVKNNQYRRSSQWGFPLRWTANEFHRYNVKLDFSKRLCLYLDAVKPGLLSMHKGYAYGDLAVSELVTEVWKFKRNECLLKHKSSKTAGSDDPDPDGYQAVLRIKELGVFCSKVVDCIESLHKSLQLLRHFANASWDRKYTSFTASLIVRLNNLIANDKDELNDSIPQKVQEILGLEEVPCTLTGPNDCSCASPKLPLPKDEDTNDKDDDNNHDDCKGH